MNWTHVVSWMFAGERAGTTGHVVVWFTHSRVILDGVGAGDVPEEWLAPRQVDSIYQCDDIRKSRWRQRTSSSRIIVDLNVLFTFNPGLDTINPLKPIGFRWPTRIVPWIDPISPSRGVGWSASNRHTAVAYVDFPKHLRTTTRARSQDHSESRAVANEARRIETDLGR